MSQDANAINLNNGNFVDKKKIVLAFISFFVILMAFVIALDPRFKILKKYKEGTTGFANNFEIFSNAMHDSFYIANENKVEAIKNLINFHYALDSRGDNVEYGKRLASLYHLLGKTQYEENINYKNENSRLTFALSNLLKAKSILNESNIERNYKNYCELIKLIKYVKLRLKHTDNIKNEEC